MSTNSLNLEHFQELKDKFDAQFSTPMPFRNGADMSKRTMMQLMRVLGGGYLSSFDNGKTWTDLKMDPVMRVEIHIVDDVPFGVVEECRCKERAKEKK